MHMFEQPSSLQICACIGIRNTDEESGSVYHKGTEAKGLWMLTC